MCAFFKNSFANKQKYAVATLCIVFFMILDCNAVKLSSSPSRSDIETGIDFVINNKSSNELAGIFIKLTGIINGYPVTFINADPGKVRAGDSMGYTNNGMNITVPPNAVVTDMKLTFSTSFGGTVNVKATIDNANPPPIDVNVHFSCYCYPDFGSLYMWDYTSGISIPSSGRRLLTVTITNIENLAQK